MQTGEEPEHHGGSTGGGFIPRRLGVRRTSVDCQVSAAQFLGSMWCCVFQILQDVSVAGLKQRNRNLATHYKQAQQVPTLATSSAPLQSTRAVSILAIHRSHVRAAAHVLGYAPALCHGVPPSLSSRLRFLAISPSQDLKRTEYDFQAQVDDLKDERGKEQAAVGLLLQCWGKVP